MEVDRWPKERHGGETERMESELVKRKRDARERGMITGRERREKREGERGCEEL